MAKNGLSLAPIEDRLSSTEIKLSANIESVSHLKADVSRIEGKMDDSFDKMGNKLTEISDKLEDQNIKLIKKEVEQNTQKKIFHGIIAFLSVIASSGILEFILHHFIH